MLRNIWLRLYHYGLIMLLQRTEYLLFEQTQGTQCLDISLVIVVFYHINFEPIVISLIL